VQLARELHKPLFMHCRDAGQRFAEILQEAGGLKAPGVLHCFTGNAEV
jgi:TatD DNase family protein